MTESEALGCRISAKTKMDLSPKVNFYQPCRCLIKMCLMTSCRVALGERCCLVSYTFQLCEGGPHFKYFHNDMGFHR